MINKNEKIIVTGAKGQLGFDCLKELAKRGYTNVLGIDKDELDITDEKAVKEFFRKENVDYPKLLEYATLLNVKKDRLFRGDSG